LQSDCTLFIYEFLYSISKSLEIVKNLIRRYANKIVSCYALFVFIRSMESDMFEIEVDMVYTFKNRIRVGTLNRIVKIDSIRKLELFITYIHSNFYSYLSFRERVNRSSVEFCRPRSVRFVSKYVRSNGKINMWNKYDWNFFYILLSSFSLRRCIEASKKFFYGRSNSTSVIYKKRFSFYGLYDDCHGNIRLRSFTKVVESFFRCRRNLFRIVILVGQFSKGVFVSMCKYN